VKEKKFGPTLHHTQFLIMSTMREPDGVKLFIGQIPKEFTETDVRSLFDPFGEIHSFNMLEDKGTGQHKGCAFLTFFSNEAAKAAQEELHGKRTLPGARNPIQVKPAQSEVGPENRKLFIGMLQRSLGEEDIKLMFSQFGTIEEVTVLRANGVSKGCAFVLFETRQQAHNAIKTMHHSQTMDGCSSPMVVKLADSEKDKMNKQMFNRGAAVPSALTSLSGSLGSTQSGDGPVSQLQQQAIFYQQLFNQLVLPQIMAGNLPSPGAPGAVSALVNAMAQQAQNVEQQGGGSTGASVTPQTYHQGGAAYQTPQPTSAYGYGLPPRATPAGSIDTKQEEGPEGANLFIYQIPTEYTDSDLMQLFTPFGTVLSAKVFLDKATHESKGFGFVSFSETAGASNAITAMNGFVIGNKRLRVAVKKKKDSKPY